jgi:hypothetical protein
LAGYLELQGIDPPEGMALNDLQTLFQQMTHSQNGAFKGMGVSVAGLVNGVAVPVHVFVRRRSVCTAPL